jgi:hypothetical protein
MDQEFNEVISKLKKWKSFTQPGEQLKPAYDIEFSKKEKGLINLVSEAETISFKLKSLNNLYNESVKDDSQEHMLPMLHAIESSIRNFDRDEEKLTDSRIISILDKLSMKPETESGDPLLELINFQLRLQLSTSDYSRANVRNAVRKVLKSVKLHNSEGGPRGYIDFIYQVLP